MRRINLTILSLVFFMSLGWSQSRVGLLPEVIATKKLNINWQLTSQLESMQGLWREFETGEYQFQYDYRRTDFTLIASLRINPNMKLSGGLLNRFQGGEHVLRSLQQVSFTTRGSSIRFGHRLRTDQTYGGESTVFRIRYRASNELPLKGDDLNINEWYLKSALEHLTLIEQSEVNMEQRINLAFGYLFPNDQRIEIGWDYRTRSLIDWQEDYNLWLMLNYYINF